MHWPEVKIYVPQKYYDSSNDIQWFEEPTSQIMERLFKTNSALVCIFSLGAVIRLIAPFLGNKKYDPAVVVIDDKANFVISALSGHLGGANSLATDLSTFLKGSKASLGSSKSLVDLGAEGEAVLSFISHLNQVGQTGATPRHPKGLATCCHGEEPHVVGWRFINERRAVNTDANCGWAQGKADVLYVADAGISGRAV